MEDLEKDIHNNDSRKQLSFLDLRVMKKGGTL